MSESIPSEDVTPSALRLFPAKHWYGNKSKDVVSKRLDLINLFFQSLSQQQFAQASMRAFLSFPDMGVPKANI